VRRMRMIWGLTVAGVLAGSLLMASPAGAVSAKKPLQGSFHEEFSFDIDCGTFLLHEDVVEDGAFTVFFDADGAPTNVIVHHDFHGVITNPAGETFDDSGDWTDFIDLAGTPDDIEDDIVAQAGSIFKIGVPGEGIVVQDTGLIIFFPDGTVEIHGPHEQFVRWGRPHLRQPRLGERSRGRLAGHNCDSGDGGRCVGGRLDRISGWLLHRDLALASGPSRTGCLPSSPSRTRCLQGMVGHRARLGRRLWSPLSSTLPPGGPGQAPPRRTDPTDARPRRPGPDGYGIPSFWHGVTIDITDPTRPSETSD
jgi:hypothetical protein